jgi:hypothetical protein
MLRTKLGMSLLRERSGVQITWSTFLLHDEQSLPIADRNMSIVSKQFWNS